MAISVHRALTLLKTLDAQINRAIAGGTFMAVVKGKDELVMNQDIRNLKVADVEAKIKTDLQSVQDLIVRRNKIKAAIVASNAVTVVSVAGVQMTVAEAIERKSSIAYEQKLLSQLRGQFNQSNQLYQQQLSKLESDVEATILVLAGKENAGRTLDAASLDSAKAAAESRSKPKFVDPLEIGKLVDKMATEIENFTADVDAVLSESNAKTTLDVE